MAGKIRLDELQRLYEDPGTSKGVLEEYLLGAPEKSRPFSPGLIPDPAKVETGISGTDTEVQAALLGDLVLTWERERRRPLRLAKVQRWDTLRAKHPPLPAGEGWGEGERLPIHQPAST